MINRLTGEMDFQTQALVLRSERQKLLYLERTADELDQAISLHVIAAPGDDVVLPRVSKHVDFECELAAVIGRTTRKVSEAQALDYVFGYTILWDLSQRDPWGIGKQNTRNIRKGFDTFTAIGPWIVTADEIPDPHTLRFHVEQNGKTVMEAYTGDMICNLRDHIRFLSDALTLRPGTVISTGTPAGVQRLAPGDRLKGTMEKIGSMELGVIADR